MPLYRLAFLLLVLGLCVTSHAQNDYSSCYQENMAAGDMALRQCNFKAAKSYYVKAKRCKGGNPEEAKKQIKKVKDRQRIDALVKSKRISLREYRRVLKRSQKNNTD